MNIDNLRRLKKEEIKIGDLWDLGKNAEKKEKLQPGSLCYSYEYGLSKIICLSATESCFLVLPLSRCSFLSAFKPNLYRREIVAVWEVEFVPTLLNAKISPSEFEFLKMLHPEAQEDFLQDVEKYLVKTTVKEKIKNIFKKVLT